MSHLILCCILEILCQAKNVQFMIVIRTEILALQYIQIIIYSYFHVAISMFP